MDSSLSPCAKRAAAFQRLLAPPQSSNGHGTGGVGTAIESPTFSNRSQSRGRPELAGQSCFPTEVRPKLPKLPARISPSFLHQIDRVRHQEPDRIAKETFEGSKWLGSSAVEVRGIHHRANYSFCTKVEFCRKSLKP
ncbi:F-box family protein with DUF295 [Prunus dulcis]|uniref:F-box family protein with DUF295 n=1 Tax=Prunus dulcis TaxID=3755 RepID=A0A5H2XFM6_PRUDU|nr:F-box family protein with DUF295 [Prunus dulcis]